MFVAIAVTRRIAPLTGTGALMLLIALLQGCAGGTRAPVSSPGEARRETGTPYSASEQRTTPASGYHRVSGGDTLYSIAWRYGLDYRDLARWNSIRSPYTIYPGDRLRLTGQPQRSMAALDESSRHTPSPPLERDVGSSPPLERGDIGPSPPLGSDVSPSPPLPSTTTSPLPPPLKTVKNKTAAPTPVAAGPIHWRWPTHGRLLNTDSPIGEKGIKIGGHFSQPVIAAAAGQVVYSGSGLIGYGKLIIIKHNETYLSAYAHNNELLVKEGDSVDGGQQIATMGMASDGHAALHFEIRRNGQPIDPLKHLPPHQG